MKKGVVIFWALIALLIIGGFGGSAYLKNRPSGLEDFAVCLGEKGATFYGTFWCSHCQNQKKLFGSAEKLLPYVECSTPDGRSRLPICEENNVESYPTWEFADGSRLSGEIPLATLAEKTGCVLPEGK